MIAEKMGDGKQGQIKAAMEKVIKNVQNEQVGQRAEKILSDLP